MGTLIPSIVARVNNILFLTGVLQTAGPSSWLWKNSVMASIIHRLTERSVSGYHINIDIHKYSENKLLLYWKDNDHKRCYTHVLERKFLEISEITLLQNHMYHSGLPGTLECLSLWEP